jgi:enamine deaminase RidA (YjgF/YER057c/UK114 family)
MDEIVRISSGVPWESAFGYSRAVKAGHWMMVAGTTATDERGRIIGINQMYVQARQAIANIGSALKRSGLGLGDVVRTRIFVTDLSRLPELSRAHRESFGATPPASTVVEVSRLLHPDMLVEIEADAWAGERQSANAPMRRKSKPASRQPKTAKVKRPRARDGQPRRR